MRNRVCMTHVKKTTAKSCVYWFSLREYLMFLRTFACRADRNRGLWGQDRGAQAGPEGFIDGIPGGIGRIPYKGLCQGVLKVTT